MAIANTLDVAYWLQMCVFTFDLDHFIDQVMPILPVNISQKVTDIETMTIANIFEVAYWLSNVVFTFDLGQC